MLYLLYKSHLATFSYFFKLEKEKKRKKDDPKKSRIRVVGLLSRNLTTFLLDILTPNIKANRRLPKLN